MPIRSEVPISTGRPEDAAESKKVLVVVDSFPSTGGARIDKFVKILPEFMIEPIVLTAAENCSHYSWEILQKLYPRTLKTLFGKSVGWSYFTQRFLMRGKGSSRYRLLQALSFPERFLMVPDRMVRWIPHGKILALNAAREDGISAVLTSSPSESSHLIGLHLKRKLGVRWVADFRDLWTEKKLLYRPATPIHDRWIRSLERRIFQSADHIIANTPENAERHIEQFALDRERVTIIPNGFDRDDIPAKNIDSGRKEISNQFRIGYSGSFDKHDFPWKTALLATKKLAEHVGRDKVRLVQCGYASEAFVDYVKSMGMEDLVEFHGALSHEDAMTLTANTEIRLVLLYENNYSDAIVPMKLYNYLIMDGPILAIAPENGRVAQIIAETGTGVTISDMRGIDKIYSELLRFFRNWEEGRTQYFPNRDAIAKYDRRLQTGKLAEILMAGR